MFTEEAADKRIQWKVQEKGKGSRYNSKWTVMWAWRTTLEAWASCGSHCKELNLDDLKGKNSGDIGVKKIWRLFFILVNNSTNAREGQFDIGTSYLFQKYEKHWGSFFFPAQSKKIRKVSDVLTFQDMAYSLQNNNAL